MDIANCQQCSKPFIHKGGAKVCPGCLDEERGMYDFYYQKLAPRLKDLNIPYIARQTTLDKDRLGQTLEYRLGIEEPGELKLWKRGSCNVCGKRQENVDSSEPICINCLDLVLNMMEKDERAILEASDIDERAEFQSSAKTTSSSDKALGEQYPASQGRMTNVATGQWLGETVPRAMYEEALQELAMYRDCFGELPGSKNFQSDSDLSSLRSLSASPKESQEVLMILDQNDEDIVLNKEEVQVLNSAHLYLESEKRRQYGFKRTERA